MYEIIANPDEYTIGALEEGFGHRQISFPDDKRKRWAEEIGTFAQKLDGLSDKAKGLQELLISESAMQICEKFWRNASEEEQRKFRKMLFNNACKMAKQIPAYRLGVSPNGRFWEKMEDVL